MDRDLMDMAALLALTGLAERLVSATEAHQQTTLAATTTFAQTESLSNTAFAASLNGLLANMRPREFFGDARVATRTTDDTRSVVIRPEALAVS